MHYILFDDESRNHLLPFAHTRPVGEIRCGILTMRERWEKWLDAPVTTMCPEHIQRVYPIATGKDNILINATVFPTEELVKAIGQLKDGDKIVYEHTLIAARLGYDEFTYRNLDNLVRKLSVKRYLWTIKKIKNIWEIFSFNELAIKEDYELLTNGRDSAPAPDNVIITGGENLFIEEGANIGAGCVINAAAGPVYIGKDVEVLEGAMLRGPLAILDHAVVKMGAKIYGGTTIGPGCKVGGEIQNVVFFANSNKAHDGYLGNSVIGEWCNLGADTNCSNLKNNYDEIKIWDEYANKSVKTGLQFCGLMMADHSKCAINTMFNTGTVVGVSANIFGGGFPEKFIPSFSWGGKDELTTYDFSRAMETVSRVLSRRNKELSDEETEMLKHVFDKTVAQRDIFTQS